MLVFLKRLATLTTNLPLGLLVSCRAVSWCRSRPSFSRRFEGMSS